MNICRANNKNDALNGYLLAIIASITYGLNPLFAVPLYGMGLGVVSVLLYRYSGALILLGVIMSIRGISFKLRKDIVLPLVIAGLLFAFSSYALFESYKYMDVGIASTILYTTPFFVAIIMSSVFHKRISISGIICIFCALVGIGMISVKADSSIQNPVGIGYVVLSALVYSVYMVLIKESSINSKDSISLTFYSVLVGILFFMAIGFCSDDLQMLPMTVTAWSNVCGLAVFPTVVSIVAMTIAIKRIGPVPTSILEALEPVTGLIVGGLAFGELLTVTNVIGIIIVIISVSYFIVYNERKTVRQINR